MASTVNMTPHDEVLARDRKIIEGRLMDTAGHKVTICPPGRAFNAFYDYGEHGYVNWRGERYALAVEAKDGTWIRSGVYRRGGSVG